MTDAPNTPDDRPTDLRLADGPGTTAEVEVDAAPAHVWAIVSDPNAPAAFSDEFQHGAWVDEDAELAVGRQFRGTSQRGEFTWTTTCTLVECEPERVFRWAVNDLDDRVATWGFELEPTEAGTTILRQTVTLGPGPSGLTNAIGQNPDAEHQIIEGRLAGLRANMVRTIEGIAGLARARAEG